MALISEPGTTSSYHRFAAVKRRSDRLVARTTTVAHVSTEDDLAIAAVELTNAAFYAAHEARDIDAMIAVWEHSPRTVCVHPGWPILRGWGPIEESWRRIFSGPGRNQFILTNEEVMIDGDMAWITLDENMVDGPSAGTIAATNVFHRTPTGWQLTLHHGSPIMSRG
ncbi:MAG: ketosteroid isomerase-like protein [Acidimicrobiales bacterium]|jgi:ketosteroid isomerase-like protein